MRCYIIAQVTSKNLYIIDFDSTLISVEALDELAEVSLARHPKRDKLKSQIAEITRRGMEGEITIEESLERRLKLLEANRDHLKLLIKRLKTKITPSFLRNKTFLKKNSEQIAVITSGFSEYVVPVVESLGLKSKNVLANSFTFDQAGMITGFDRSNPLGADRGKIKALQQLKPKGDVFVIGDGYTDFQMKESGLVTKFYAFVENVEREVVVKSADGVLRSFDEFLYQNKLPMKFSYPRSQLKVLLLEAIHPVAVELFKAEGYTVETRVEALDTAQLERALKDVALLGLRSKTQLNAKTLRAAKRLMAVGAFCIGTDQVDLQACSERGVIVFNAPYSNTRSVVELALGEMIMLMRQTFALSVKLHAGEWQKSAAGSFEVRGKKLGIVGYGNIGAQLSVLAESLGMEVYFYDLVDKLALGNARKCRTLNELLRVSDVVTLHVDGRASNRNLFSTAEFNAMKSGAVFLNLARGAVVDIAALVQALNSGKLGGAGVDVYPEEPKSNKEEFVNALRGLPNVILTPHVGGSTAEAQRNIAEYTALKLLDYVNRGSSYFSVNFPQIQLPSLERAHRLLHLHHNVPGILAKINGILARSKINILGQYLKTNEQIGYVITDVDRTYDAKVVKELGAIEHTIKFRTLY